MRRRNTKRNQGYTLVELMLVSTILVTVVNILSVQFVTTFRLHRLSALAVDRCEQVEDIGERFRRATREATGFVETVGPYTTNADQIILSLPNSPEKPSHKRYAVLGAVFESNRFTVIVIHEAGGALEIEEIHTTRLAVEEIEFVAESNENAERGLLRLNLSIDTEGTKATLPEHNTFIAAFRSVAS